MKQQRICGLVTEPSSNVRACFTTCAEIMLQVAVTNHLVYTHHIPTEQNWQNVPWYYSSHSADNTECKTWKNYDGFQKGGFLMRFQGSWNLLKRLNEFCRLPGKAGKWKVLTRFINFRGTNVTVWPQTLGQISNIAVVTLQSIKFFI